MRNSEGTPLMRNFIFGWQEKDQLENVADLLAKIKRAQKGFKIAIFGFWENSNFCFFCALLKMRNDLRKKI